MDVKRDSAFDSMFDEVYPEIVFGEVSYAPSDVLASVDPIAYRVSVGDYHNSLCEDGEHGDEGTECEWCGETL